MRQPIFFTKSIIRMNINGDQSPRNQMMTQWFFCRGSLACRKLVLVVAIHSLRGSLLNGITRQTLNRVPHNQHKMRITQATSNPRVTSSLMVGLVKTMRASGRGGHGEFRGTSNRISIDLMGHTAQPTHLAAAVTGGEEHAKKAAGEAWPSLRRTRHLADCLCHLLARRIALRSTNWWLGRDGGIAQCGWGRSRDKSSN
jgi:hypothetical protein